jgi:ABC-2 type transport system permease protein
VVFGVRIQGSAVGFLGVCAAFSLMTAAFGLLIAALGRTPEATRGLAILATLLMVMLGGGWVPTFVFPQWLQKLTILVPTRWAMDGLDATTWRGLGLSSAIGPIAVLLGCTVLFGGLAVMRFRWEADG